MADPKITVLEQIDQLEEIVLEGSRIPFSGGRLVNEQDAVEVMDALREAIPPQIAQAVDLIRQREDFIAQAQSTRDLWSGSFLLSWLMAHAMKSWSMNIRRCCPRPVSSCSEADPRATTPATAPSEG